MLLPFMQVVHALLLCISTSKWVLGITFASWNHFFLHLNKFFCLFPSQMEKKIWKRKKLQKHAAFGCQPAFKCNTFLCMLFVIFCIFFLFFCLWQKKMEILVLVSKKWFRLANGMRSTSLLVEIHNTLSLLNDAS